VAIGHHRGHDEACPSIIQSKLLEMCEIHSSKHFVDTTLARDPSEGVPRVALGKPTAAEKLRETEGFIYSRRVRNAD
jgi:hypothetical protein